MSIIVAVKKENSIVIASDSVFTEGDWNMDTKYRSNTKKIFSIKDSFVGIVGESAHHNVMMHLYRKQPDLFCLSNIEDIFDSFLKIHPILEENYYIDSDVEDEGYQSSQIHYLIANSSGIFEVRPNREVNQYHKFWAIGSGRNYALGSMYTQFDNIVDPIEIAKNAVLASCEFSSSCGLPVSIETVNITKLQ